jgi:ketosteroid isomerase-like protein
MGDTARAMSSENVELVKQILPPEIDFVALVREGDVAAVPIDLSRFAEDLEVSFTPGVDSPETTYRGIEGLLEGWEEWLTPWESYDLTTEDYVDAGEHVVVLARIRGRTSRDHVVVEHSPAATMTISDGLVVRMRFYLDRAEALEAAGADPATLHRSGN